MSVTVASTCGDGLIDAGEQCDDANTASADGCSSSCQIENGWICVGEASTCGIVCGDGVVLVSESCDDGNRTNGDGCNASCDVENTYVCTGEPSSCTTDPVDPVIE